LGIPRLRLVQSISIKIRTPEGKTVDLEVFESDTVRNVKAKVSHQENVNYAEEKLCILSKVLSDEEKIGSFSIKEKSQLYFQKRSAPPAQVNTVTDFVLRRATDQRPPSSRAKPESSPITRNPVQVK
jgi:hypothetical protein